VSGEHQPVLSTVHDVFSPRRVLSVVSAAALSLGLAAPAVAAPGGTTTETTSSGLRLTVSPVRQLPPTGATVRVKGSGFDRTVGIYVALCVLPRAGQQPGPCGGGVNTTGANPASAWVSSTPPPYGKDLAVPYGRGGRFDVTLTVSPFIGDVDCRVTSCAVVTRADHLRSSDRRFDVAVPVRFTR
jgi:hypothetical protein